MIGRLKDLIKPILDQENIELVDLVYRWEGRRNVLRLLIDKPGGVSLDDCARVNKSLSAVLDTTDLISGSFILEVSSPGLDRPLAAKRDFEKRINEDVRFILKNDKGTTDIVTGSVKSVGEDRLVLDINGVEREILFDNIIKAKLEIEL